MGDIANLVERMFDDGMPIHAIVAAVREIEDTRRRVVGGDFATFWALYPNKVGKRAAEKAYASAIRRADPKVILDGLHRYAAKQDDRPWCNPATWLGQDRWEDQTPVPINQKPRNMADGFFAAAGFGMEIENAEVRSDDPSRGPVRRLPGR